MADEGILKGPSPAPVLLRPLTWQDFQMEFVMIAALVVYILLWWQGSSRNLQLAQDWMNRNADHLKQQFAWVGGKENNSALVKDGPADFLLYTSGRRYVQFAHWWIKLKPRNSMILNLTTNLLYSAGQVKQPLDQVTVDFTLAGDLPRESHFVFAVVKKELAQELRNSRYDIKSVGKEASGKVASNLVILSESQKLVDELLNTQLGNVLSQQSTLLESLIITDLPKEEPEKWNPNPALRLSMTFAVNQGADDLVKLACQIPDILADLKLPSDAKSKIQKNREDMKKVFDKREREERMEQLAKEKAEKKRAEEGRIRKLSPEEQRKWDEKERIRTIKKEQKKRMKRA